MNPRKYVLSLTAALLIGSIMLFSSVPVFAVSGSSSIISLAPQSIVAPAPAGLAQIAWPADNITPPHPFPPPGGNPPHGPFPPRTQDAYPWWYTSGWPPISRHSLEPRYFPLPVVVYPQVPQPIYYEPVVSSFTASPNHIQAGQASTLVWYVSNADLISISPSVGSVAATGSLAVIPAYTTTYTLTATNRWGSTTSTTAVTVEPYAYSYSTYGTGSGAVTTTPDSGSYYNTGTPATDTAGALSTSGVSSAATTTTNPWLISILLIGLLAVAAAVIVLLLIKKPAVASAPGQSSTSLGHLASTATAAATATLPATMTPVTARVESGLSARLISTSGTTMPVTGKPLGRRDFQSMVPPGKGDSISRQHILVTYENGQYQIEDLNSTNGTRLNGFDIGGSVKHTIENGDNVELAGVLKFTFKV
jgi:hypothetical protein